MSLDSKAVLKETALLEAGIRRARRSGADFPKLHQKVLDLSAIVFNRKSQYGKIDIQYPRQITVVSNVRRQHQTINLFPDIPKRLGELSKACLEVLGRIRALYSMRQRLEGDDVSKVKKKIRVLSARLSKLERQVARMRGT